MRQFTIAERLIAAVLLPFATILAVPYVTAALAPFLGETNATYARIIIGLAAAALTGAGVLVSVRRVVESYESFVIQGWRA